MNACVECEKVKTDFMCSSCVKKQENYWKSKGAIQELEDLWKVCIKDRQKNLAREEIAQYIEQRLKELKE